MKQYEYYVFDKELPFEYNFFLTKVLQSYRHHAAKKDVEEPYAYINYIQQRQILGEAKRKEKINQLIQQGFLEERKVGVTLKGDTITGFIPIITSGYKRQKTLNKKAVMFYVEKNSKLPKLNLSVFKGFSKVRICIDRSEWRSVSKNAYNALKSNASDSSKLSRRSYNKKMNELYETMLDWNRGNTEERMSMCSVDDFGNRFHSVFSRIPKVVRRNYLSWGDVTELDLAQSQPTLLAQLLYERIGSNEYSDFIFSGEYLYNYLGKGDKEKGRSVFNNSVFGKIVDRRFKKVFPIAAKEIAAMKYERIDDNPSPKTYSNLCSLLQRKETYIFEKVWGDLLLSKVPFIPVHDSVIVPTNYFTQTQLIMNNTLQKYLINYNINFNLG